MKPRVARARYVPDEVDSRGHPRSMTGTCLRSLTSQALISALAETAF